MNNSFDDFCYQLAQRESTILKNIPPHLLSHILSVVGSHMKSFDQIMKSIMELENTPRISSGEGIRCHIINPEAGSLVWRHHRTNHVHYTRSNPTLEFPLRWTVTMVTDRSLQKTFGSIHFFINEVMFPVTRFYLAYKASTLDFVDIFDKVVKKL